MPYVVVTALGVALAATVWLAGRRRWPWTIARSIGVAVVLGATAVSIWAVHEGLQAAAAGRAAGDAFGNLGRGWK